MNTHRFTREDFFRELAVFRELMGSRDYWAKPPRQRDIAVKALGFVYINAAIEPEDITTFCATMEEHTRREVYA